MRWGNTRIGLSVLLFGLSLPVAAGGCIYLLVDELDRSGPVISCKLESGKVIPGLCPKGTSK